MILAIYQSLIIHIFVLLYDFHTLPVEIKGNVRGLNSRNGTELECSYTKQSSNLITVVSVLAYNRSSSTYDQIAIYVPNSLSYLTDNGQYLKGRVTLMNITQSTTKAVITFKKLMCIDDTLYQCRVNYITSSGVKNAISNSTTISVQVPASKPDHLSMLHTPETVTMSTVQIANLNDTSTFNYSTTPNTNHNSTSSTPSNADFSSDISNKSSTHTTEKTTSTQGKAEGDNITVVCRGDVGNPPAKHVFQKYRGGRILSMNFTATETSISQISENCSYYRTSNFTFRVTVQDSNAVIRCAVDSPVAQYDNLYLETAPIEVYSDISTTQSSSTGSSSGVDDNKEKTDENSDLYKAIGSVSAVLTVIIIIYLIVMIARKKRKSKSPTFKNESKSFVDSKPKQVTESGTGDYDYIALKENTTKIQSVNNELEVEDIREHNKEYFKIQEEKEQKKKESNTPPQPAVYAQVNEATKSRNKQNTETRESSDKQEEDAYAETQDGIYDKAGDRRHKENENVEHFDSSNNSSKQNSNGDDKLSIQTSKVGSYANQAFEKDENRKVATMSPTIRSSSGSQNDEQTNLSRNSQSKKGYENIISTDQTGTSEEDSFHRTAL